MEGTGKFRVRPEKVGWEQEQNAGLAKEEVYCNGLIRPVLERDENNLQNHKKTTEKTEQLEFSISVRVRQEAEWAEH